MEASHRPHLENAEENQACKNNDARKAKRIKLSARALELLAALSGKRISITDIEFSHKDSQDGGTFADVAAATLIVKSSSGQGERKVAVKKLRLIDGMNEERLFSAFVHELCVLDKLSHPNIVEIIGFVEDMGGRIAWLVFPWEENGNLRQFLRSGTWELPERVSLINDVVLGLKYLHTRQPPIRHGDLKSLNILVNSSNRAVITDFGSARMMEFGIPPAPYIPPRENESAQLKLSVPNNTLTLTGPVCSTRWAPPEFLIENALDLASDIWALGWIAWEAITDSFPFEELDSEVDVTMRVVEGRLPTIHDHQQLSQIHRLCGIMQTCWKLDPRDRLSATECRKAIKLIPQTIPSAKSGNQSTSSSARLLLEMGEMHRLHDRRKEALEMFEQGLAIAQSPEDQSTVADLLVQIAETHRIGSDNVKAEVSYTEALAVYKTIGDDLGRANALDGLGDVRRAQSRYIEAEGYYTEALDICKIIGYDLGHANALQGLGHVRRAQSKHIEAEASHDKALTIYKTIGDDMGRANALQGLGDVRRAQSKYIEAEAALDEALAICKTIRYGLGQANALEGLGHVQRAQSKHIEAEASHAKALAIYKTIGDGMGRANALQGLGDAQRAQSKFNEAEASYAKALAICKTTEYDLGQANSLRGLGDVQREQSKYIDAEASYVAALAVYKRIGQDLGRVDCSLGLVEIWIRQARHAEAKALVEDVASVSKRMDYAWGMDTSDGLLRDIAEAEGSPDNPLTLALPTSTRAEDSAPRISLPETDEFSATSP